MDEQVVRIYNEIEIELLIAIAKRFDVYDKATGTLEWQLKKLDELGGLSNESINIIAKHSKRTKEEILKVLKEAGYSNLDFSLLELAYEEDFIAINPDTLKNNPVINDIINLSYKELDNAFKMINTKALESVKSAYMNVLNTAYLEVSSGVYDYQSSIRKALRNMANNGITGATYRRGMTTVNYSLEGTIRRDVVTATHQLANKVSIKSCEELGCEHVEVSSHIGARVNDKNPIANHFGWQGKVYKINGRDEKYDNLKEKTGYPDDILGLGGVNCRHRMFPFFPGISKPTRKTFDKEENQKLYDLTQKQRVLERRIREEKKRAVVYKNANDLENYDKSMKKLKQRINEINKFCKDNGLDRDYSRELVTEQL